ncbi:hypothetical protein B566_EDAN008929 [Ephemera danica]|nr:hypothetical protein B566_EDAN008929 [Ephemera danica]
MQNIMATKLKVEITSYALSTLLGDNANCEGDQEGFLFGDVFTRKGRDITDQDADGSVETTVIRITSHMFLLEPCEFYNRVGQEVVGYFDFKRELPAECLMLPGFRMAMLFRSLCEWGAEKQQTLLLLRQNHISRGTINNNYCFFHLAANNKLVRIASEIPNLGDTSQRQYVHPPTVPGVDNVIKKFLNNTPTRLEDMQVVKAHEAMMKDLEKAAESVDEEERKYWESHMRLQAIVDQTKATEHTLTELLVIPAELQDRSSQSSSEEVLENSHPESTSPAPANVATPTSSHSISNNQSFQSSSKTLTPNNIKEEPNSTPTSSRRQEEAATPSSTPKVKLEPKVEDGEVRSNNSAVSTNSGSPVLRRTRKNKT